MQARTPLHIACAARHVDIQEVQALLRSGARRDARDTKVLFVNEDAYLAA